MMWTASEQLPTAGEGAPKTPFQWPCSKSVLLVPSIRKLFGHNNMEWSRWSHQQRCVENWLKSASCTKEKNKNRTTRGKQPFQKMEWAQLVKHDRNSLTNTHVASMILLLFRKEGVLEISLQNPLNITMETDIQYIRWLSSSHDYR